ncbi:unnamed protein product [Ectocarpus sp. CCAP 1310/34]|nr:unnamed protein product [Ectocarpus sp. CCAP 1310/34]
MPIKLPLFRHQYWEYTPAMALNLDGKEKRIWPKLTKTGRAWCILSWGRRPVLCFAFTMGTASAVTWSATTS